MAARQQEMLVEMKIQEMKFQDTKTTEIPVIRLILAQYHKRCVKRRKILNERLTLYRIMKQAHLTILVVFLGVLITWTLARNLNPRSHKARTDWKDPCKYNVQKIRSPSHTEKNSSCSVSDITGKWIPELKIVFKEIIRSLDEAIYAYTSAHGFEPSHMKIDELEDPTNNVTFDKLINRENNTETEKIIYRNYSSLTILAAYLNMVNSDEWINNYGKDLSDAITGIRGALCNLKMLAIGLALEYKDVFPTIWEFSHHFQTESDSQLMNLNETVLTYGQKILANLTATFEENVASSLSKCSLKCDKKRRMLCKNSRAKRQRKGKGKGKKNKSKKQRKNKKDKGRNRSS